MFKYFAVFLIVFLAACSHEPQAVISDRTCPAVQNLPVGRLLLFGEMHGSVEAPRLISEIACSLSKSGEVAVGLEISSQDQPLLDRYVKSRGTAADVKALTSSDFWQKGRDGRSSEAMLRLIEDLRQLKAKGRAINLFAFDDQPGTKLERNAAIANGIRRFHAKHAKSQIIALMGNVHAQQQEMIASSGFMSPSGRLLRDLNPVSILITHPSGTTWACMPQCGIQSLTPSSPTSGPVGFKTGESLGGYGYSFLLSSVTASPPAVQH